MDKVGAYREANLLIDDCSRNNRRVNPIRFCASNLEELDLTLKAEVEKVLNNAGPGGHINLGRVFVLDEKSGDYKEVRRLRTRIRQAVDRAINKVM